MYIGVKRASSTNGANQTEYHLCKNEPGCLSLTCIEINYSCIKDYDIRPGSLRRNHEENSLWHGHKQRFCEWLPAAKKIIIKQICMALKSFCTRNKLLLEWKDSQKSRGKYLISIH